MSKEFDHRREIIVHGLKMNSSGLSQGTSGNLSVRWSDGMLVTPSGIAYDALQPEDIVFMKLDGSFDHPLAPSSEWRFHRDIYVARPEVNAVVHAHPTHCTALAIQGMEIPAVHYMIASAGGPSIRCASYHTYGTEALSVAAIAALENRSGCLLAHHGMIATGANMAKAMWLAVEMEALAHLYILALQLGKPRILPDEEIARVVAKFAHYGLRERA
ncbi:L-fuculose-1-phosphate aldolase [Rubrivivax sp. A210]|uniref:class II aldolase/adducin family protein n=1 Tax=Rubrivivax sp. A210 TaxID=2772301 RepID=UPI001918AD74|nr:class II aldolase/adducin family protein [Rubrivivax sp. A210]CAD5371349.1 L-fuculose-1-phosphate aldolase [Rubrivivax sp. A210]